jgi:hypothetical protein
MIAHATQKNHDAAREEWFRRKMEKRRMKEAAADPAKEGVDVVKGRRRTGEIPKEKTARL